MEQTPGNLSLISPDIWKGGATHNGLLLKIHTNEFTTGYSSLTPVSASALPAFGSGCWYDAYLKNNQVFMVKPSGGTTVPVFAGILARNPSISSGYPASAETLDTFKKGTLVKEGFVEYKKGSAAAVNDQDITDIQVGMFAHAKNATGVVFFSANMVEANAVCFGHVFLVNPDDSSWTVRVSVSFAMQIAANALLFAPHA